MRNLVCIFLVAMFLQAHSLKIFVSKGEQNFHIKAYFSDVYPCKNAQVIIESLDGKILTFRTDERGMLSLFLKTSINYISVEDGLGHKKTISFNKQDTPRRKSFVLVFWLKILFAFVFILVFFAFMRFAKKSL